MISSPGDEVVGSDDKVALLLVLLLLLLNPSATSQRLVFSSKTNSVQQVGEPRCVP